MPATSTRRLRILLLCDDRASHANTVLDHIDAFRRFSRHEIRMFNPVGMPRSAALALDEFDAVVIHYSLVLPHDNYVSADFKEKLRGYRGLKVQFIQDEYRWVDRATAASREIGVDVLFTCAPEPAAGQLYDRGLPDVRRVETLTGYVPEGLRDRPRRPLGERPFDIGYRGRDLPFWLGRLTQEKAWIAQGVLERAAAHGLRVDIGWLERDRIYGDRWIEFISSCRATLGTESGASIADFDGSVEAAVRAYLAQHPEAGFDEVDRAVLRPYEGNVVVNVVSPRVFEAAALGTALVMFPGTYSGVVAPKEHYIVLEKDFSNMAEVAGLLKDLSFVERMVERTHHDLIASGRWSYRAFIAEFDSVVSQEARPAFRRTRAPRHRLAQAERLLRVPPLHHRVIRGALGVAAAASGRELPLGVERTLGDRLSKGAFALRATLRDPELRAIYRQGRRAGMPRLSLVEEITRLGLLRSIGRDDGTVDASYSVSTGYDQAERALRFVTRARGLDGVSERASTDGLDALQAGMVETIVWDHSAAGTSVRLSRSQRQVGVGPDGVLSFPLISTIGRGHGVLVRRALEPLFAHPSRASRVG